MPGIFYLANLFQMLPRCLMISSLGLGILFSAISVLADTSKAYLTRPLQLLEALPEGALKSNLQSCPQEPLSNTAFSIGHRGAPMGYAEHTEESYRAAVAMGAGIVECDVTFTQDQELVCRHSQCDLHTTTNILETPLAAKCSTPPNLDSRKPYANVRCCTSDLTLSEFKTLQGKMDAGDKNAGTLEEYMSALPRNRMSTVVERGTLLTHRESIRLFKSLGVKMIPELKEALVPMPYQGNYSYSNYADAVINDYIAEGIDPSDVFLQSFRLQDVQYWLDQWPEFGRQAVWLDGRYRDSDFDIANPSTWTPTMQELADSGVQYIASPLWMLMTSKDDRELVPSRYAKSARAADLSIIPWTIERSGSLRDGGDWYYQSVRSAISADSDMFRVLALLADSLEVPGVFSDWPATTTYFANCYSH